MTVSSKSSPLFPAPEEKYMRRAIQLAYNGAGFVSPNPMVGAVIVAADGRIIGEGWHRKHGGPHAEVNAVASVADADVHLLKEATIYVTLEPCSHYGKTPPCSLLLIEKGLGRVVIGSADPFPLVSGRGVKMLRNAGIEVIEDFLREECDEINRKFITAHTRKRPYILLKWAQSADGFIAAFSENGEMKPVALSSDYTKMLMHSLRAQYDAILIGTNTAIVDNPSLTTRLWPGKSPVPVLFDSPRLPDDLQLMSRKHILLDTSLNLDEQMHNLYKEHGITSLMVEGGAQTLDCFLKNKLYDEIRVEVSPKILGNGVNAPQIPCNLLLSESKKIDNNLIY
ncbi:MAG: bifunctional diaminohydroxyphosphoribosylaminopyrimidine deaminase/5-amino-6-(5-phosphoribosylamino)uracil reductase RibD, partial [Muribaculaceae bacterium]|nr:bifunctional diaminohydroxyphosphoribosylaminopyrimidine deaminase/5-amino-6-(5-phosphoribosylamino)uracil reductase RibD [Muribaculaceae bacterium]